MDPQYLVALKTPCVYHDPTFLRTEVADVFYKDLLTQIKWEKTPKINRWVSLHHNLKGEDYKYRDAPGAAKEGFNETIDRIRKLAEEWYEKHTSEKVEFNVCLLNYYENGQQRIGWHSDREEIGRTTPIASVSLGASRQFLLRSKENGMEDRAALDLQNGSLVIMENVCQMQYLHSVPKQSDVLSGRINLTFRCKAEGDFTPGEEQHELRDNFLNNLTDGAEAKAGAWSPAITSINSSSVFGEGVQIEDVDEDYPEIHYLVSTNLGAEKYCGAEMQEMLAAANLTEHWRIVATPLGLDGFVACTAPTKEVPAMIIGKTTSLFLKLRSAQHILDYHCHFNLQECGPEPALVDGETLYQFFKKQLVDGTMSISSLQKMGKGTFRVSCERIGGPHAFKAPEVEFEMGGAMSEFYPAKPKMSDYDVCVYVFVVGNVVAVGTQLNVHDLSKERHFLKFRNAVTIKTNLAYAMVRLAAIKPGDHIADPFCGSGTLLLEALETFNKRLTCVGMDVSRRSAEGARQNALAENCGDDICKFVCCDARGLRKHLADNSVDAIISNLPWGIMTGSRDVSDLKTMYEIFLRSVWYTLKPGARIVMLVLRGLQITRIVRKLGGRYRLLSVNVVRTTNNLPCIVVVEKLEEDELLDAIKGQLSYYNQFVNVSPQVYHTIHNEDIDEHT
eukprot:scaffold1830_cov117-Cylindrotheca_fusiformis.AAC.15